MYQPTYTPLNTYGQQFHNFAQSYNVPSVMNKESAMAYSMPINSSILLLEEQTDKVFFVQTDSAGMKQITTYQLVPYKEPEPISVNDLDKRMAQMEAMQQQIMAMLGGMTNAQSNTSTDAATKQ